ncbi:hypothetical protein HMPREF9071_1713 [Capnocytophaga sp. oral taxon 338 str. F0234]|nr:hypothetical protein HMPREF9071_1713 [Capnocytophaga sp. oral taxon 338 str. F0234]
MFFIKKISFEKKFYFFIGFYFIFFYLCFSVFRSSIKLFSYT